MKRKYADRAGWSRILNKSYSSILIDEINFYGHIAYLELSKVKEPLLVTYGYNKLCIVDDSYVWLQHFPIRGDVVLTSTFDQDGHLVQCYFDIVKSVGVTLQGIPYCDDLFIDVVVLPNGEIYLLDEDELEEAYKNNVITEGDYEFAKCKALELVESIKEGSNYLMNSTERYYTLMKGINLRL
jgi:predicted RNA-binding protein associated with RNAse of E/G family